MLNIRHATEQDFKSIYDFVNELEDQIFDQGAQQRIFLRNLEDSKIIYLLAFEEDEPAGYISCHAQWLLHHSDLIGEIQEMFVVEKFRSRGVGKLLLEELIKVARSKNISQLEVTSSKKREEAHRFYIREGFADTHKKFTRSI